MHKYDSNKRVTKMGSDELKITIDDVAAILFDEFDQPTTMSPKAFHKITYFIDKYLNKQGYETGIDYFWYKYGTMTATVGSTVMIEPSGDRSEVLCSKTPNEITLDSEIEEIVRSTTREVLDLHGSLNTEGLTDLMYEDAPYDFQRKYRKLDTVIQTEINSQTDEATEFDRESIRLLVHEFIDAFPENEFKEYLNDLYLWYDILSATLDNESISLGQIEDIVETFWSIIMLDIGTSSETGIEPGIFADELNIDDPDGLQGYLSYRLQQLEDEHLGVVNPSEYTLEASDAIMMSQLEFAEI